MQTILIFQWVINTLLFPYMMDSMKIGGWSIGQKNPQKCFYKMGTLAYKKIEKYHLKIWNTNDFGKIEKSQQYQVHHFSSSPYREALAP